jgi:4-hydroxybenzoate polyprenyltransferase
MVLTNNNSLAISDRAWAYLQLMRPANIITAWADILAGFAASGVISPNDPNLAWLLLATTGLYGGGVVFNDIFDAELDREERPERPIPSGRASRQGAIYLGVILLVVGIIAAINVSFLSFAIALGVAIAALLYDAVSKHNNWLGPLNMGCCRGGNLLLGMSIVPEMLMQRWWLALLPIIYIAAITAISQGEVRGGKGEAGIFALCCLVIVFGFILAIAFYTNYLIWAALPFLLLLAIRVVPPFVAATLNPQAETIKSAVKAGVLSLIVLNATLAAGFAGWLSGLLALSLLPLSMLLAKKLAVT